MTNEKVLVIDFGGQYNQLIARRVREFNVYCEMYPYTISLEKIKSLNPIGIIFTGGPSSVTDEGAPRIDKGIFDLGIPVLGICYGAQLIAYTLNGKVEQAKSREYGKKEATYDTDSLLFKGLNKKNVCWMSHTYQVTELPQGFKSIAHTDTCKIAAFENEEKAIYGMQYHPEVMHTEQGLDMLKNFLYYVVKAKGDWTMSNFVHKSISELKAKIGDKKVLCAFSGGVDSAVAATLIHKAVGDQLTCIFVDHGLLRKNEAKEVMKVFKEDMGMNVILADASERFLKKLQGVKEPEKKRKIIGKEFIDVFEIEAKKIGAVDYLVQGTIYPDEIGRAHV